MHDQSLSLNFDGMEIPNALLPMTFTQDDFLLKVRKCSKKKNVINHFLACCFIVAFSFFKTGNNAFKMCAFSPLYWRRQTITWGRYLNPGGGWKSDEGSVFWNLGFLSFWNLELYDFHNIVRLSDINNKKLITHDNLSILNLELTWHQLLYSSLSNCGVTHCTTQAFSVDCLLYATLLYKRECLSCFIHLQHQSLHFRLLLDLVFRQWNFRGTNPLFDHMEPEGRNFGDNGIGSWDWLHFNRMQFIQRLNAAISVHSSLTYNAGID